MSTAGVLYILTTIQPQLICSDSNTAGYIHCCASNTFCLLCGVNGFKMERCCAFLCSDQLKRSGLCFWVRALVSWVILVPVVCWAEDFDIRANVTVSDCFGTSKRCGAFCKTSEKYDLESHFKLHFPHRRVSVNTLPPLCLRKNLSV